MKLIAFKHNIFQSIFLILILNSCQQTKPLANSDSFPLSEITISKIQQGYNNKEYTVKKIVTLYLDRIQEIDDAGPELNSILMINPDAIKIADSLDKLIKTGENNSPLFGIPIVLKDNINTADKMPTTGGSRILKNSFPRRDSWVAKKIRDAGGVIIAKANLSEWANYRASFSSSGWSGLGGQTKNPYVLDRNPCGSSSGSAVAVSSNLCAVSVGTETWGSIICPSNANGIVGIKPTVGLWSRSGILPISYTQDTAGPMARTVRDAAIFLGALTGIDKKDKKSIRSKGNYFKDYTQFLKTSGLNGKRIGYLKTEGGKHFRVDTLMNRAVNYIKSQGAEIINLDKIVEGTPYQNSIEVLAYEFKDGIKKYFEDLGDVAAFSNLEEIIEATSQDSIEMHFFDLYRMKNANSKPSIETSDYKVFLQNMLKAYQKNGIDKVMDEYKLDAIVAPSGAPAWKTDKINGDGGISVSTSVYAALSGYPNISVPMGFIDDVPVGISFFGKEWSEPILIEIAFAYEQGTLHRSPPKFLVTD